MRSYPSFFSTGFALLITASTSLHADTELITNGAFDSDKAPWVMDALGGAKATFTVDRDTDGKASAHINVATADPVAYHVQLFQSDLDLKAGQTYHFSFRAKASQNVTIGLNMMAAHAPWSNLWKQDVSLTSDWQTYAFDVTPSASAPNARVTFTRLASQAGDYWFDSVSVTTK